MPLKTGIPVLQGGEDVNYTPLLWQPTGRNALLMGHV